MERLLRYPVRYVVPLAFVLFAGLVGSLVFFNNQWSQVQRIEDSAANTLRVELDQLQGILQLLLRTGNLDGVQATVASLGATPGLDTLWLTDSAGAVIASNDLATVGRLWSALEGAADHPRIEALVNGPGIGVSLNADRLIGYAPVCGASQSRTLRPLRCGSLIIIRDLDAEIAAAIDSLRTEAFYNGVTLFAAALALSWFIHAVFNRRIQRLLVTAKRFAAGNLRARARLQGGDELATVGAAFDDLLDRVVADQRALANNETRLRDFADSAADTFWELGADLRFTYAAGRFVETMGIESEFLIGKTREELFRDGPGDPQALRRHVNDLAAHRAFVDFEVSWARPDGTVRRLQLNGKPIFDESGEFKGYRGTGRDVTEQRQADALNQTVLTSIPSHIALLDRDAQVTRVNDAWTTFACTSNKAAAMRCGVGVNYLEAGLAVLGQNADESLEIKNGIQSVLERASDEYVHEYPFDEEQNKRWFSMSVTPCKGPGDGVLVTHTDITGRKASEQTLWESHQMLDARVKERTRELSSANRVLLAQMKERDQVEAQFRGLLDSAPDAMVIVNESGVIELVNTRTEAMFGYPRHELIGQPVERLLPTSLRATHEAHRQGYARAPQVRSMGQGLELNALTKQGRELPVEISLSPLRGESGTLISAAIRDISERREYVQAMKAAKDEAERASSAKSRFLAFASHDLRQPLQSLGIYLDVLQRKVEEPDALDIIGDMNRSLTTMGALLNALLDVSKLEAKMVTPELADFPIQDLLGRVFSDTSPHAQGKGLTMRIVPSTAIVRTDPILLEQILRNFVFNAIRYTESGRVLVGCRRRGKNLSIEVWDSGIGIANDSFETIFEDFVQLDNEVRDRTKGLGLGLAIVTRTANLLGHTVQVASKLGAGSVFSVQVPIGAVRPIADVPAPASASVATSAASIFFIEDDADIVHATGLLLKLNGFDVVTADSADNALRRLEDESFRPDLLLCDYRLPDGVSGVELITRIRNKLGDERTPAIIATGDTSPERLQDTGSIACEVLHKPVRGDALISTIRRLLDES